MNKKYLFNEATQTPEGMVSVSQLQSFMSCPKKWEYGYIEGLTPRVERAYLSVGKLCHKGMQVAMQSMCRDQTAGLDTSFEGGLSNSWLRDGLEAMRQEWDKYMGENSFLPEELPELDQTLKDAAEVFSQAFVEFEPWKYKVISIKKDKTWVPALELHFCIPCAGSKGLHGYIDAILVDTTTGCTWCTDYKFRKSLSPDTEEETNIQNAVYTKACAMLGINISGTMTWQHVNTPASTPTILKDGKVSRAKIKTTWAKYRDFLLVNGKDPEDYREEMEPKLADIEWYRATYEYRNVETVQRMWDECIVPTAKAVKKAWKGGNPRFLYPWNCKMCQFRSLCQGELRGYDPEFIRISEYTKRSHLRGDNKPLDEDQPDVV